MEYTPDWPEKLPCAEGEISTSRFVNFKTFIHDKTDLHAKHGEGFHELSTAAFVESGPQELKSSKSFAGLATHTEMTAKVTKLNIERARRAAELGALEPGSTAGMPTQVQHSSTLRAALGREEESGGTKGASSRVGGASGRGRGGAGRGAGAKKATRSIPTAARDGVGGSASASERSSRQGSP